MRIKRFTPAAATLFNLIASDVGRSLFDITHKLDYDDLADDARAVFATLQDDRARGAQQRRPALAGAPAALPHGRGPDRRRGADLRRRHQPARRRGRRDAGARAHAAGRRDDDRLRDPHDSTPTAVVTSWSAGAGTLFGYSEAEALGQPFEHPLHAEDRAAGVPEPRAARRRARPAARPTSAGCCARTAAGSSRSGVTDAAAIDGELEGFAKICPRHHRHERRREDSRVAKPQRGARAGARGEPAEERVPGRDVARAQAPAQPDQRQRRSC